MSAPAGWYPDPAMPGAWRFWNGYSWTSPAAVVAAPPRDLRTPGVDGNTVWIWLVVLLPLLPLIGMLFTPWGSMFDYDVDALMADPDAESMRQMFAIYASPSSWAWTFLSYAVYGVSVYLAYRDRVELQRRGIVRPFHWGWAFLNPVYAFGRSIVVHRRTGRGMAPLWVTVGVLVVSFIVTAIAMSMLVVSMMSFMGEIVTYSITRARTLTPPAADPISRVSDRRALLAVVTVSP